MKVLALILAQMYCGPGCPPPAFALHIRSGPSPSALNLKAKEGGQILGPPLALDLTPHDILPDMAQKHTTHFRLGNTYARAKHAKVAPQATHLHAA